MSKYYRSLVLMHTRTLPHTYRNFVPLQRFSIDRYDHTIDTYTGYLQEVFLLLSVQKFSYKSRDRIRDSKIYVIDNGFISNRTNTFSTENLGLRLENAVYVELLHRAGMRFADVFYYRDRSDLFSKACLTGERGKKSKEHRCPF